MGGRRITMPLHTKWINGNLVYYDTYLFRLIDAFGVNVCKFLEDFVATPFASTDTPAGWTVTLVESGAGESTVALTDGAGGLLLITTDAAENDGVNMQVTKEAFKLASGKPCYFGIRFKISESTESDFFVGLAITDTDILGAVTDSIGFKKVDGATTIQFELNKDSTATAGNVGTAVADTYVTLEFYFDGTNVDAFVDGVLQTRLAQTNLPNDEELTPSIQFLTGSANARTMTIDWIRCIQIN
jgi:hypothetical protein